jgi:hypothetical protein
MNAQSNSCPLPLELMPVSFTGQFLYALTSSDVLNPPNRDQERTSIYFGKPLRAVVRMVVALIVPIFASLVGTVYHAIKTIALKIEAKKHQEDSVKHKEIDRLAQAHGYAALIDATVFFSTISCALPLARGFSFISSKSSALWTAKHFPDVKMNDEITYKEHIRRELISRADH